MEETIALPLESQVQSVTVYTDRAMVTRFTDTIVDSNHFILEIGNLPREINETTLQVKAWGLEGLELQEVRLVEKYHSIIPDAKIKTLKDELERLQLAGKKLQDKLDVLDKKEDFIDSIKVFSSESINKNFERTQPNPTDWNGVLDFLGSGYQQVNEDRYTLEEEKEKIDEQLAAIQHALKSISGQVSQLRKSAIIEFMATQTGTVKLLLTYEVRQARWRPFYEARVDSQNKVVGLRYYGLVEQRTGEDWMQADLKLSTARPHIGGNAPTLQPWYLDIFTVAPLAAAAPRMQTAGGAPGRKRSRKKKKVAEDMEADFAFAAEEKPAPLMERSASVEASTGSSVVFVVPGKSDVPGDGSSSRQLIMENEFGAEFRYLTVPKVSQLAYLTASVKNETEFPMLPGKISIFIDGNFIGKASVKELITPEERFELNLGIDENIKVRHKLLKKLGDETGIFSKSKRVNYSYLITIDNQRSSDEEIIVRDQLPVSQNDKIKVDIKGISPDENPAKDKDKLPNGAIEWKLSVPAKGKAKCEFSFSVEYAADLRITGM